MATLRGEHLTNIPTSGPVDRPRWSVFALVALLIGLWACGEQSPDGDHASSELLEERDARIAELEAEVEERDATITALRRKLYNTTRFLDSDEEEEAAAVEEEVVWEDFPRRRSSVIAFVERGAGRYEQYLRARLAFRSLERLPDDLVEDFPWHSDLIYALDASPDERVPGLLLGLIKESETAIDEADPKQGKHAPAWAIAAHDKGPKDIRFEALTVLALTGAASEIRQALRVISCQESPRYLGEVLPLMAIYGEEPEEKRMRDLREHVDFRLVAMATAALAVYQMPHVEGEVIYDLAAMPPLVEEHAHGILLDLGVDIEALIAGHVRYQELWPTFRLAGKWFEPTWKMLRDPRLLEEPEADLMLLEDGTAGVSREIVERLDSDLARGYHAWYPAAQWELDNGTFVLTDPQADREILRGQVWKHFLCIEGSEGELVRGRRTLVRME